MTNHYSANKPKKANKSKKPKIEKAVKQLVKQYFATATQEIESGYLHTELIRRVERELILQVMKHTDNNQSQAAKILGISRTTFRKKLKDLQLP